MRKESFPFFDLSESSSQDRATNNSLKYEHIYEVVRQIPFGKVTTYGQIARYLPRCGARQVGYAMAALPNGSDVPWHRVINAQGRLSERKGGGGTERQRSRLIDEGIVFDARGCLDFSVYGWQPAQELEPK